MKDVAENLRIQARRCQRLIIWTDCDREGEYIGVEIERICLEANARIDAYRARYSVVSPREIHRAMNGPDRLDRRLIAAVASRQEIDLRTGASLTRLQSMQLQSQFSVLSSVISYGSCQFPTLGFVVEQYLRLVRFVPSQFWTLRLVLKHEGLSATFQWDRHRLFDRHTCAILYSFCMENETAARITSLQSKPTSRWRPLPLRTVEFQKKAAKSLRMSSDKLMSTAESLYNQGYISYPRTETDQFDSKFDHKALIAMQTGSLSWGDYSRALLEEGRFRSPRMGKNNDKAHPPIHPTKAGDGLTGDELRVYEFIVRSYLGACSEDAKGQKTTVNAQMGSENFHAQGVMVTERNYLDVYPYDFWNDKMIPAFRVGQELAPEELMMDSGQTTAPQLLSESDLIGTMDKNGIGTDATIHEHIKKILERKYVIKMRDARFVPTLLGLSLVQGYDEVGLEFSLTKPRIRAMLENDLNAICEGRKSSHEVVQGSMSMFRSAFDRAKQNISVLFTVLGQNLRGHEDPFAAAPLPSSGPGSNRAQPLPAPHGHPPPRGPPPDDSDDDWEGGPGSRPQSKTRRIDAPPPAPEYGPDCGCGRPSIKKKTVKPGPNQGRFFWSCSDCNFFSWVDAPGVAVVSAPAPIQRPPMTMPAEEENPPICDCGKAAVVRTVSKEGPNKGRTFYSCASGAQERCQFFIWKDHDNAQTLNHHGRDEQVLRCACGLIAVKDAAKSGANAGRSFYRCSKQVKRCTFFQWEGASPPERSTDQVSARCFKCGEVQCVISARLFIIYRKAIILLLVLLMAAQKDAEEGEAEAEDGVTTAHRCIYYILISKHSTDCRSSGYQVYSETEHLS